MTRTSNIHPNFLKTSVTNRHFPPESNVAEYIKNWEMSKRNVHMLVSFVAGKHCEYKERGKLVQKKKNVWDAKTIANKERLVYLV